MMLITGGTGLVGSHLLFRLTSQGESVKAICRASSNLDEVENLFRFYANEEAGELLKKIEWIEADLADYFSLENALEGINQVFHVAAMVSFNPGESQKMLQVNAEGTANLVNACLEKKVEKLCYVSSISSLGKPSNGDLIDENVEWQPDDNRSAYSHSKFRAEMEVWRASKEGLPVVIVNPSIIIGPVNWLRSSGRLFYSVYKGMPFYSDGTTGFVDVRDVAEAMVLLMTSDIVNQRFILNSEHLSFKEFFTLTANALGVSPPWFKASKWMVNLGWRLNHALCALAGKAPALTRDTARSALGKSYYSNKKFTRQFNYTFRPIKETIDNTAKWYLWQLKKQK